jgi:TetR/AcrR family transcriptional repressor of nem operon
MARTKSFDPDTALGQAVDEFWAGGYEATTAEDLVEALGVSRSSLYETFGSKHELYTRALERYRVTGSDRIRQALGRRGPVRARMRRVLRGLAEDDLSAERPRGCFALNAAVERAPIDAAVRQAVAAAFAETQSLFRVELARAKDAGELDADADVEALSAFFFTVLQGIRVVAKGTGDRRLVEQAIDASLAVL